MTFMIPDPRSLVLATKTQSQAISSEETLSRCHLSDEMLRGPQSALTQLCRVVRPGRSRAGAALGAAVGGNPRGRSWSYIGVVFLLLFFCF